MIVQPAVPVQVVEDEVAATQVVFVVDLPARLHVPLADRGIGEPEAEAPVHELGEAGAVLAHQPAAGAVPVRGAQVPLRDVNDLGDFGYRIAHRTVGWLGGARVFGCELFRVGVAGGMPVAPHQNVPYHHHGVGDHAPSLPGFPDHLEDALAPGHLVGADPHPVTTVDALVDLFPGGT